MATLVGGGEKSCLSSSIHLRALVDRATVCQNARARETRQDPQSGQSGQRVARARVAVELLCCTVSYL